MKAIILAAGYGARMRPLTDSKPKAMLEIAGQTIIGRILRSLAAHGISEVCVVTGHCREQLEGHLKSSFPGVRFTFVFNKAYRNTNNIYSMHLAFENFPIDDDVLLIESDLVFDDAVLEKILKSKYKNVALVDKFRAGMDGTVVTVNDGLITNIIPPHLQGPGFDFSDKYKTLNIYKFSQDFARTSFRKLLTFYATTYNDNCYYELILGILIYMQHERIFACEVDDERWCEVDDTNDVRLAEMAFNRDGRVEALDKAFGGFWNIPVVDFAFIRNMYFPNHSILSDMRYNLPDLLHNYGSTQAVLNQKLAYFLLVPEERVCLLNGLSQLYPILEKMVAGKTVLMPRPTFLEYERIFRDKLYYDDRGYQSLEGVISPDMLKRAEVVLFVNPNNPTGSFGRAKEILALAEKHPEKLFLVDESFVEFTMEESVQEAVSEGGFHRLLVLKSLSKSLGVPGLRLGYVYGNDRALIRDIQAHIPIWNSNSMAEYFLEVILKHRRALAESFSTTVKDREKFAAGLAGRRWVKRVFPSGANFLLVELAVPLADVASLRRRLIEDHQLFVKDVSSKFNDGAAYLRLAVRLPEENHKLVAALDIAVGQAPAAQGRH